MKRLLAVPAHPTFVDGALLLLRVIAGAAFMFHGWMKIQNPFGWMGPEGFAPAPFQALAAMSEFGGGLGWILGLLTPIASLGILCTMMVAMFTHLILRGDPFVSATGGPAAELASVYFAIALLLIALGPGRYSLDRVIFGSR